MNRAPDERVTEDVAREICQRQGLKAYLAGSINNLGSNYVIALEAVNAQSGEEIAREQVEATNKEGVLKGAVASGDTFARGVGRVAAIHSEVRCAAGVDDLFAGRAQSLLFGEGAGTRGQVLGIDSVLQARGGD